MSQLADLFWQLEYCETPAVTPTIELAKLALVTSRDEEEDEADKGGTDSSNDTDATLVDDAPSRFPVLDQSSKSPPPPPGSVLGKRPREQRTEMDVDGPMTEGYVMVPLPQHPNSPASIGEASSSKSHEMTGEGDNDIEMRSSPPPMEDRPVQKPPPILPRKPAEVSDSVMMFGEAILYESVLCSDGSF
jgi:ubiquitin carboxyl-terminal hydrolase 25